MEVLDTPSTVFFDFLMSYTNQSFSNAKNNFFDFCFYYQKACSMYFLRDMSKVFPL